jgi:ABC-type uncharacterized transport system substrate-binding protein
VAQAGRDLTAGSRRLAFWRFPGGSLAAAWLVLLCAFCVALPGRARATTVAVVLSDDGAPYQETADALEAGLGKEHTVVRILATHLAQSEAALNGAKRIVTVGVKASRLVAERSSGTPILAVLVPRAWYESTGKAALADGGRPAGALFIDQPLGRQFHLVRAALPGIDRVAVILGKQTADQLPELERQAKAHRISLVSARLDESSRLVDVLGEALGEAEALLLPFPDPEVLTRTSAPSIFMTSYRYGDPVVGYSQSLAKAGAMLSVYSTPAQIGRQAAELLARVVAGEKIPAVSWPQYFSISVNANVARSLGIALPPESTLLKRVQEAESRNHD